MAFLKSIKLAIRGGLWSKKISNFHFVNNSLFKKASDLTKSGSEKKCKVKAGVS